MSAEPEPTDRGPVRPVEEPDTGTTGPRSAAARGRKHVPLWQELVLLLAVAAVLAVVIKTFFLQAFYIPSASMHDTLIENDRILVEKPSYWGGGTPQRGDVVVFADPGGWLGAGEQPQPSNAVASALETFGLYPSGGHLVKRVIAVGGDEVKCCDKQGRITVNGVPLHEKSYLASGQRPSLINFDVKVQPGYLWVQGDNRSDSADSRVHLGDPGGGQVPVDDVVGKVFAVVWPFDHATLLHQPATFASMH